MLRVVGYVLDNADSVLTRIWRIVAESISCFTKLSSEIDDVCVSMVRYNTHSLAEDKARYVHWVS